MRVPSCSRVQYLHRDCRTLKAASGRCLIDSQIRISPTLSRTHPPAMRQVVCIPFSARCLVQSSKRTQSCDSTSVRRISRRSGMGIGLRSIWVCRKETERDMMFICGVHRSLRSSINIRSNIVVRLCHETPPYTVLSSHGT